MSALELIQLTRKVEDLEAKLEVAKEALRDARLCIIAGETKSAKMKCEEALAKLNLK